MKTTLLMRNIRAALNQLVQFDGFQCRWSEVLMLCDVGSGGSDQAAVSHLDEASWGQRVHEDVAPGVLHQQVGDEPHRGGVHLLEANEQANTVSRKPGWLRPKGLNGNDSHPIT